MLFIHGALGSAKQFNPLISLLSNEVDCHAIDLPQHGLNTATVVPTMLNYVDYCIDYIEQHFSTPIPIFGYSMGGYIALLIGHKRPDLVQQIATLATKFEWEPESTQKQLDKLDASIMAAKIPAYTAYLDSLHTSTPWQTVVENTHKVITDLGKNPPISNQLLSELQMPCRLGVGDHDVMVSVNETYERYRQIKQGSFYVLPNTIHPLEHVSPELLAHQIKHFITN